MVRRLYLSLLLLLMLFALPLPAFANNTPKIKSPTKVVCPKCNNPIKVLGWPLGSRQDVVIFDGDCEPCHTFYEWAGDPKTKQPIPGVRFRGGKDGGKLHIQGNGETGSPTGTRITTPKPLATTEVSKLQIVGTWTNRVYRKFIFFPDGTLLIDGLDTQGRGSWTVPNAERKNVIRIDHPKMPTRIHLRWEFVKGFLELIQINPQTGEKLSFIILLERCK